MRGSPSLEVFVARKEERDSESRVFPVNRKEEDRRCRSNQIAPAASVSVEKALPNGDVYHGEFFGTAPQGWGKYLWTDGCKYEGEWRKGKASGRGRFAWPSGATYDGDFKSGRMDGSGSFIGSDGDAYTGSWSADRKHGYGQRRYANGDVYEGWWRKNLQEGQGRYVWGNGNEYVGEWKNGVISGRGVLIWANGNRFDGEWEQGFPNGNGVFTWSDGSCYVASSQLMGTFYPPPGRGFSDYFSAARKRSSFDEERNSSVCSAFSPRICLWKSDGEDGDITCDIIDNVQASIRSSNHVSHLCKPSASRKTGQSISKGHKNYELMLDLQLGIRYSVGRCASLLRDLKSTDFDPKEKIWTRFPPAGSKKTPPHHSAEFRWKDYCPMVFRHLRELFQVDPGSYMLAVCGNDALRELRSPGKSGSVFYLTQDDRFMIKTVKKAEVKVLIRMLPSYYNHVRRYENSLLTKFYGVHCVKPNGGPKTRFIVMWNLFYSDYRIHRRFDLKGSSYGRAAGKSEFEIDETTTLKDLDLDFLFRLQKNWFNEFISQIDRDCEFLENEGIMDYSLLLGLHFRGENTAEKFGLSPFLLRSGKSDSFQLEKFMRGCRFLEAELKERDRVLAGKKPLIRLGANMPARAERMSRRSDSGGALFSRNGQVHEVILYFGIIDILQGYDISKKLERAYKSLQVDPSSISAVDPKLYSKRFRDFVRRIFVEDR